MTKARAPTHPYWKLAFGTVGVETLRGVGFRLLERQDDRRITVVRKEGALSLYIEQNYEQGTNASGSNTPLTCQWMHTHDLAAEEYPCVDMTLLLWEALVFRGMSNLHALFCVHDLVDPKANAREYKSRRSIRDTTRSMNYEDAL